MSSNSTCAPSSSSTVRVLKICSVVGAADSSAVHTCGPTERAPLLAGVQWCCADLHHREEDDVAGILGSSAGVLAVGGSVYGVQCSPDGREILTAESEPVHGCVPVLL